MKHITKKRVSHGRKRGQVRTQARPRKRASVTRYRKKNKSRRGLYTKKKKVMVGGVKPEDWDDMTFNQQMTYAYDESFWGNLDDDTKINLINKIPTDNIIARRLKWLNEYNNNSQTVKDAIANRMSSAGLAVSPEGSHRLSPTSSPRLLSSRLLSPLPDFSTVALKAHSANLSRHPSSHTVSSRNLFKEEPSQRTVINQQLLPQGPSQPVDPVVISSPTSPSPTFPRPYLEQSKIPISDPPPSTPPVSIQTTAAYKSPGLTQESDPPLGDVTFLPPSESIPAPQSVSRKTQQPLPPSRPPPPPPRLSGRITPQPQSSESIPPPPPSHSPPFNIEPVLPPLEPPNLLGNLPPVQNGENIHEVPINPTLLKELETKNKKTNKSYNNNSRTVMCDCTRSSTSTPTPTPISTTPTPTSSRFSRAKDSVKNWFKKTNKAS